MDEEEGFPVASPSVVHGRANLPLQTVAARPQWSIARPACGNPGG
jgi:hypothetical protein